ncbi:substrate-binding domain-containing protein [Streptomyces sp. JW3]|uniref:substrate-binding domain-containing protein n=1 Tax=Streptomyces sp. JW3 TaxID=3456955 RepID=UPI003FA4CC78
MVDRQMDGLILIAPGTPRAEVLTTAQSTPTVVIGHHDVSELHDSVVDADGAGAALVVDHLVGLGHRNIALVFSPGTRSSKWARTPEIVPTAGYTEAMGRHGLAEHTRVCRTAYSDDGGYKAGMSLLTGDNPPTAIMAGADVAALGVWRAAHELGLRVPEDLSLAGYNNTALADLATVQLTSVDQAGHDMGGTAARLLIQRVEGQREHAVQTTMTPRLVVRRSTTGPGDAPEGIHRRRVPVTPVRPGPARSCGTPGAPGG